ncbi:hypothetical protein FB451DRAFT_1387767 [Mycena latifolia]|nr:hypothetical protein FB451DRAFT_1387767 [Mycena latifolia]
MQVLRAAFVAAVPRSWSSAMRDQALNPVLTLLAVFAPDSAAPQPQPVPPLEHHHRLLDRVAPTTTHRHGPPEVDGQ